MPKIDISEMGLQLTGDGQTDGSFTVADPSRLKIGARVTVSSLAVEAIEALIDDVDVGGLTVYLRLRDSAPDLSAYLVIDEAFLNIPAQQLDYRFTEIDIGHVSTPIPVVVGGFPLPVGGATEATQLDVKTNTGNVASRLTSGAQITQVSNFPASQVVTAAALPLPSGASTSAKQDTGNSSLSSIDGKTPALGQAAMAASVPVVLASNQGTLVTAPAPSVFDSNNTSTATLAGGATFTGTATDVLGTALILVSVIASSAGTLQTQFSDNNVNWDHVLTYDIVAEEQFDNPVRPHGKWFRLIYINGSTPQTYMRMYSTLKSAPQGLSSLQLRTAVDPWETGILTKSVLMGVGDVPASHLNEVHVSDTGVLQVGGTLDTVTSLPLPSGASTSAKQDTGNSSLSSIDSKVATAAKQDTGNSSLSSIDSKVATAAKQDTGNSSLSSIDGKTPALGQAAMAASVPVVLASNQTVPVSGSVTTSMTQTVILSAGNSSTANLGDGNSFTGTGESTLDVAGIQVVFKTDVDCTVWVEQSSDNSNWDVSDRYNYDPHVGNFGITVQAVSAYFRVRVQNTGGATSTYFRLSTVLCPVIEALPRSLDANGFLKTGVADLYNSDTGNHIRIDQFNTLKTSSTVRLVGTTFYDGLKDPNFWTETVTGSGAVASALGQITLTTGVTINSTSQYQTVRVARFIPYCTNVFRAVVRTGDLGTAFNVRRWGGFFSHLRGILCTDWRNT